MVCQVQAPDQRPRDCAPAAQAPEAEAQAAEATRDSCSSELIHSSIDNDCATDHVASAGTATRDYDLVSAPAPAASKPHAATADPPAASAEQPVLREAPHVRRASPPPRRCTRSAPFLVFSAIDDDHAASATASATGPPVQKSMQHLNEQRARSASKVAPWRDPSKRSKMIAVKTEPEEPAPRSSATSSRPDNLNDRVAKIRHAFNSILDAL